MAEPLDLDALAARHMAVTTIDHAQDGTPWPGWVCPYCQEDAPCDAWVLLALARAQVAELAELRRWRQLRDTEYPPMPPRSSEAVQIHATYQDPPRPRPVVPAED
jgi:hypothetical protein